MRLFSTQLPANASAFAVADEPAQSTSLLAAIAAVLAKPQNSPETVLQSLVDAPLTGENETNLLQTLRTWSEDSADDAAVWIETTLDGSAPGSAGFALRRSLLSLWLEIAPPAALDRLATFAEPEEVAYLIAEHAVRLADAQSPEHALQWSESLTSEPMRTRAIDSVVDDWLIRDAEGLVTELLYRADLESQTSPNTNEASDRLSRIGGRLVDAIAANDPEQAMDLAQRLNGKNAEAAQKRVFVEWLAGTPDTALRWVNKEIAVTGTLPDTVAGAIPTASIDVAMTTVDMLEGTARNAMTEAIVETLSESDPYGARNWINRLNEPELSYPATRAWIFANASQLPEEVLREALVAASSPQYAGSQDLLMDTAVIVAKDHPRLLRDWLANASIDASLKARISAVVFE